MPLHARRSRLADGHSVPAWAGYWLVSVGTCVVVAWATGSVEVSRVLPRAASAVMFIAAGFGLLAAARAARLGRWLAAGVMLAIAAGSAGEHAAGRGSTTAWADGGGVLPLSAAVAFLVLGASLALLHRASRLSYASALVGMLVALVGVCGYVLSLRPETSVLPGMSPVSLLGVAIASLGLLGLSPALAPFAWFSSNTGAAQLARRLVPVMIGVPLALGLVYSRWTALTGLSEHVGAAVVLAVLITTLTGTAAVSVRIVDTAERAAGRARFEAEQAVLESERRFRALALEMPVGVVRRDASGRVSFVNDEALRIFGIPPGESLEGLGVQVVHPDDREAALRAMHETITTGVPYEREWRAVRPSGEVRCVLARGSLQTGEDGTFGAYLSTLVDITDRRAAEQALADEEQRSRSLASAVPVGILRMNAEGTWTYANERLRRLWHMAPGQEPAGVDWVAGLHPDDRERIPEQWAKAMAADGRYEADFRILAPGGSYRWAQTSAVTQHDADGNVAGFIAMMVDIHERRTAQEALAQSEALHRLTMANLPDATIGLYDRDLRCMLIEGQRASESMTTDSCYGKRLSDFAGQAVADDLEPVMRKALLGEATEMQYASPAGTLSVFQVTPFRDRNGAIDGVLIVSSDFPEQRRAELAEREATERFRVAFDQAPIGIVIVGLNGRFEQVNDALTQITGYDADQLKAQAPFSIVHIDDLGEVQAKFSGLGEQSDSVAIEHRIVHAQGHALWVDARVTLIRDDNGNPVHALAQILDITERRSYEAQLQHMAEHDALTGLLNRRGLEQRLETQMAHVRRYGGAGALLMLDLDGFKLVNDTLGHAIGDELIIGVGVVLRRRLRETDTIARLGGDEFAVILPHETHLQALQVAQDLVRLVREHAAVLNGTHPGQVTASIGVASFDAALTAQDMLIRGDLAMYDAKEAGKDQVASYADGKHSMPRVKAQMTWIDRITAAIEHDRFVLYAQPIFDLQQNKVVFHEILVQMLDDHGDLIPPATFLYIAERFGLAPRLDAWIINKTVDAMASERSRGRHLPLSINLSGASVGDPSITELLQRRIHAGQIDPADLIIELTETAAVSDIPRAQTFAETLNDLGMRLALDDFGAGFGSFYYVKHLPFDIFKLDGEFVQNATSSATDREIIAAVTHLAKALGKQTVAEFVQDDATIRLLRQAGTDMAQGFHLGKPSPLDTLLHPPKAQGTAPARASAAPHTPEAPPDR